MTGGLCSKQSPKCAGGHSHSSGLSREQCFNRQSVGLTGAQPVCSHSQNGRSCACSHLPVQCIFTDWEYMSLFSSQLNVFQKNKKCQVCLSGYRTANRLSVGVLVLV